MKGIYLLLGSNMGNSIEVLQHAKDCISKEAGSILQESKIYKTAAWGIEDQPDFLNQVIEIESNHNPHSLLEIILGIEKDMGRVRKVKWGQRLIDIDILYYNQTIVKQNDLTIPHPYLHKRRFTLVPLAEISPQFLHPVLKTSNSTLLKQCIDNLEVSIL